MTKDMQSGIAAVLLFLALAAAPAAASDGNTNVDTRLYFLDQDLYPSSYVIADGGASIDTRLLFINEVLYPTTYEDHAYACTDGNCTDW